MVSQRTLHSGNFPSSLPLSLPSSTPLVKMPQNPSEVKAIIAAAQEEAAQKRSLHHQLSEDSGAEVIPAITQVIRLLNWALLNYLSNQYGSQDDVQRDRPLLVLASQWVQSDWIQWLWMGFYKKSGFWFSHWKPHMVWDEWAEVFLNCQTIQLQMWSVKDVLRFFWC